ncbi:Fe-S cluster assembly protein HesB [Bacillus sp. SD-4]|nr:Fe-S cluster assembly protein HesB [Bacillus sp. SD-4]
MLQTSLLPYCSCFCHNRRNINKGWDTYVADDVVYEDADLIIQMDSFTKDYTGNTVKLDYKTTGFSITTPSETLVYGLSIKK